jgi:hypothetical protein
MFVESAIRVSFTYAYYLSMPAPDLLKYTKVCQCTTCAIALLSPLGSLDCPSCDLLRASLPLPVLMQYRARAFTRLALSASPENGRVGVGGAGENRELRIERRPRAPSNAPALDPTRGHVPVRTLTAC